MIPSLVGQVALSLGWRGAGGAFRPPWRSSGAATKDASPPRGVVCLRHRAGSSADPELRRYLVVI